MGSKAVGGSKMNSSTSSISRGIGESVAFAASITGAPIRSYNDQSTHSQQLIAQSNAYGNPRSTIVQQHRKQQKSKLEAHHDDQDYYQLTPTPSVKSDASTGRRQLASSQVTSSLATSPMRMSHNTTSPVQIGPSAYQQYASSTRHSSTRQPPDTALSSPSGE